MILFIYTPNNGFENSQGINHPDVVLSQRNNLIEQNIPREQYVAEEADGPGDTDRLGRVLMKGKEVRDTRKIVADHDLKLTTHAPSTKRNVTVEPTSSVGGIKVLSMGCYSDVTIKSRRALQGAFYSDLNRMSLERCLQYCSTKGYAYAGVEFSSECYCGHSVSNSKADTEGYCNMTCSGNKMQICGGAPYISVYKILNPGQSIENFKPLPGNKKSGPSTGRRYDFRACVPLPTDKQGLVFTGGITLQQSSMTIETCTGACGDAAHPLAGLTRNTECHCGHLTNDFDLQDAVEEDRCNAPCPGDEKFYCGAENYVSIYQTSQRDDRCMSATLKPSGTMPLIALASFPGSGNTWVRYLIERATGVYTGSYYDDGDLYNKGYRGEREPWTKRNTIAVKTHRFDEEHISAFDGAILIIRDPYKAILSEHNRKFGGHTGFANERHYTQGSEWIDFVTGKSRTWANTAINFLQYSKKVLVVHYEDLRSNLLPNLINIVKFLEVPIDKERLLCTISSPDGKYKRPAAKQQLGFDPFTDEMKEFVTLYIKGVSMALYITNQTKLPDTYNPQLRFLL